MRKYLLLPLALLLVLFYSCSKNYEDRLIGSWRLDESYRKMLFGRDYFQTGYEDGVFTFLENGNATYVSSTDTLTGYWRANNHSRTYYNQSTSEWETKQMRYLRLSLKNFLQNKFLEWDFDNFSFRNNWKGIKAEQYSLSNDRVYEFVRQ